MDVWTFFADITTAILALQTNIAYYVFVVTYRLGKLEECNFEKNSLHSPLSIYRFNTSF